MTGSYKTKRCEHCGPNDITCDFCAGVHHVAYSPEEESKRGAWFRVALFVLVVLAIIWVARP